MEMEIETKTKDIYFYSSRIGRSLVNEAIWIDLLLLLLLRWEFWKEIWMDHEKDFERYFLFSFWCLDFEFSLINLNNGFW